MAVAGISPEILHPDRAAHGTEVNADGKTGFRRIAPRARQPRSAHALVRRDGITARSPRPTASNSTSHASFAFGGSIPANPSPGTPDVDPRRAVADRPTRIPWTRHASPAMVLYSPTPNVATTSVWNGSPRLDAMTPRSTDHDDLLEYTQAGCMVNRWPPWSDVAWMVPPDRHGAEIPAGQSTISRFHGPYLAGTPRAPAASTVFDCRRNAENWVNFRVAVKTFFPSIGPPTAGRAGPVHSPGCPHIVRGQLPAEFV
jgi:hypothetical protein